MVDRSNNGGREPGFEERALARSVASPPAALDTFGDASPLGEAVESAGPERTKLSLSPARVLRYKWTILGVFVLIASVGLAGVWTFAKPLYQSTAQIEVQPKKQTIAFDTGDNGVMHFYTQFMNTQVQKIGSARVIERVLDRDAIKSTSLYAEPSSKLETLFRSGSPGKRLYDGLQVAIQEGSSLINIEMTWPESDEAAQIANAIAEEYLKAVAEDTAEDYDSLDSERARQEEKLKSELASAELEADQYRKELKTVSPEDLVGQQRLYMDKLTTQRDEQELRITTMESELARMEALTADTQPTTAEAEAATFDQDPQWKQLSSELSQARFERDTTSENFGPQHPKMVRLTKTIEHLEGQLKAREQEIKASPPTPTLAGVDYGPTGSTPAQLRWTLESLKSQKEILDRMIERKANEFNKTFDRAEGLSKVLGRIDDMRARYDQIRQHRELEEIERYAPASIRLIAKARPSGSAYEDPRKKFSLAAIFGALVAGLMAGLARAYFAGALYEIENVSDAAGAQVGPLLGPLPLMPIRASGTIEEFSIQAECVRMVRTALLQRLREDTGSVVQITSAGPGAGKTTFAIMLAKSLAMIGKRVLLVDADLRKPSVATRLGIEDADDGFLAALLEVRQGEKPRHDRSTNTPGLRVLPMGRPAHTEECEILATSAPRMCLERWREKYDAVLLDCSPILPVADARILAQHADGTIFVVREDYCDRRDVHHALQSLRASGGELLGTVFNGARKATAYRKSYYAYAGEYGGYGVGASADPLDVRGL